jgi:hypothetical protein
VPTAVIPPTTAILQPRTTPQLDKSQLKDSKRGFQLLYPQLTLLIPICGGLLSPFIGSISVMMLVHDSLDGKMTEALIQASW